MVAKHIQEEFQNWRTLTLLLSSNPLLGHYFMGAYFLDIKKCVP